MNICSVRPKPEKMTLMTDVQWVTEGPINRFAVSIGGDRISYR